MAQPTDILEILAAALDADDYKTARTVISDDVEYRIGDLVITDADEVIDSYRTSSEMARRIFDKVEYGHQPPERISGSTFKISYQDILTIGSETLVHQAEQHLTVEGGLVVGIVNINVPGERQRVDEFLSRHGRSRDD